MNDLIRDGAVLLAAAFVLIMAVISLWPVARKHVESD